MKSVRPFRWKLTRREQLVRLPQVASPLPESWQAELRACAARLVGAADDADLVFLGRSPESLFDYLSGVLAGTSWQNRLELLLYSNRGQPLSHIRQKYPGAVQAMRAQWTEAKLAPNQLLLRPRPVAIIDLVSEGGTFEGVNEFLDTWSAELRLNPRSWRNRLRFVGIVRQRKNSPNAFRWQQHAPWLDGYPPGSARNVSVSSPLWDYLGNTQMKVTPSNPPQAWGNVGLLKPPRDPEHLEALQAAAQRYAASDSSAERARFTAQMANQTAMRERWYRALIAELQHREAQK